MSRINVLVAATSPDVKAEVISATIGGRPDMNLIKGRVVSVAEVNSVLKSTPSSPQCALVLVGPPAETEKLAERWLAERADLVVLRVDIIDDIVRIALRDPRLDSLLSALRGLVDRVSTQPQERISHIQMRSVVSVTETSTVASDETLVRRPLLHTAIDWIHKLLRDAVERVPEENGDVHGLSVTRATLLQSLDAPAEYGPANMPRELMEADAALTQALADADVKTEPLAAVVRALELDPLEFRMMLLALAPELDPRYQRCDGFLLDEMGRRVGTFGLYTALLGAPTRVRRELAHAGALARWRIFEGPAGGIPAADEPLRVDPFLVGWVLGERLALEQDPRVRRAIRLVEWRGASVLNREAERVRASSLVSKLQVSGGVKWNVFASDEPAGWRALIELGAQALQSSPIRVEIPRLAGLDVTEIEESGIRLGRMARLTGQPLVIDTTSSDATPQEDDWMRLLLAAVGSTGCQAGVICTDDARVIRLIGSASYELIEGEALQASERVAAVIAAAKGAEFDLREDAATALAKQYSLQVDGLEQAMRVARNRRLPDDTDKPLYERFVMACKDVAAEGVSRLSERIEPVFMLDDVVLPTDRKQQLEEIVDSIRLATQVLDGWKFGEQLPYGRGVAVLFHGPSGTGKTMAALGIARQLGIQILRIDLSRIVSKYIGDTEKNIDCVFNDAQKCGAAILIDEADALLGKRSEVKDAHDRYANIEVAYLLQRMETYEGLAILTTNLRQNLDPAFLRRLRFIVDFPRPDADAREKIWRRCLPDNSHTLDEVAFRQLARRVDLTGGHIRQITLRAAFAAAGVGAQIGLEHVAHATRAEFAKLGMAPVEIDLTARRKAA